MSVAEREPPAPRGRAAGAAAEVVAPRVEVRHVRTDTELDACVELQMAPWGAAFRELVPGRILEISRRPGGVTAGAFADDGALLGFVFGMTGVERGEIVHWSDMLAVREGAKDRGIGRPRVVAAATGHRARGTRGAGAQRRVARCGRRRPREPGSAAAGRARRHPGGHLPGTGRIRRACRALAREHAPGLPVGARRGYSVDCFESGGPADTGAYLLTRTAAPSPMPAAS